MRRSIKTVGLSCLFLTPLAATGFTTPLPQQTFTLPEDRLAVTVASASQAETDPLDSELTIWVGEIELQGRKTIWVELIDAYGEVIYESEVGNNETHLLPDGRAIAVSSLDPQTTIVKSDESRVESEGHLVFTRRIVDDGDHATAVEFVEAKPLEDKPASEPVTSIGAIIWEKIVAFFEAAATRVQIAWGWLFGSVQA